MKLQKLFFFLSFLGIFQIAQSQSITWLDTIKVVPESYENVKIIPLSDDKNASSFLIFVKREVARHQHAHHTELVYVLEGKGKMQMGDSAFIVKKGDFIVIPPETPHYVKVLSRRPMKVLSIQTPQFDRSDIVPLPPPTNF